MSLTQNRPQLQHLPIIRQQPSTTPCQAPLQLTRNTNTLLLNKPKPMQPTENTRALKPILSKRLRQQPPTSTKPTTTKPHPTTPQPTIYHNKTTMSHRRQLTQRYQTSQTLPTHKPHHILLNRPLRPRHRTNQRSPHKLITLNPTIQNKNLHRTRRLKPLKQSQSTIPT